MATKPSTVTMVTTLTTVHQIPDDIPLSNFLGVLKIELESLGQRAESAGLLPETWKVATRRLTSTTHKIEARAKKLRAAKKRG